MSAFFPILFCVDRLVQVGVLWCIMTPKRCRFSVSLTPTDNQKLVRIAKRQRPPLTKQYLVHWAIQKMLIHTEDRKLDRELGNPLQNE